MTIKEIANKFVSHPDNLRMGAGKLSKRWKCSESDIQEARKIARHELKTSKQLGVVKAPQSQPPTTHTQYVGSSTSATGDMKMFQSMKPLTPEEIHSLVGVDGISTDVGKITDSLNSNGTWTYRIEIKKKNFYTKLELKERLKEIFPSVTPVKIPLIPRWSEKALVVLLSDDHAGALNGDSMYGNQWNASIYAQRLLTLSAEIKRLGQTFEEVHVLSLGDQMNGFNSQTTRGGHEVTSVSNKEQFDIYTSARRLFYDDLFTSAISNKYYVHDVENSNHTGNDFSYMANKLLEVYLEARYPQVNRKSYFLPIDHFHYGCHTIGFGHGKDDKLMFKPMPLKLDMRTDLFLYQYFDKNGASPANRRVTMYKGDLHSYAVDKGKFGRYINVPSMMGSTDYTEANFGNTEAGAVLEILEKNTKNIQHIPIWF